MNINNKIDLHYIKIKNIKIRNNICYIQIKMNFNNQNDLCNIRIKIIIIIYLIYAI